MSKKFGVAENVAYISDEDLREVHGQMVLASIMFVIAAVVIPFVTVALFLRT